MDFRIDEFDVFEKGDFMETIRNVEINQLHDFKNHPFKVEVNTELCELMKSIEKEGVLVPLLARQVGESVAQIKRYIRLTNLIPKILAMVDEGKIAFTIGVELSYLSEEEQYELHAVMDLEQCTPSLSQANRMKRMSQRGELGMDAIYLVLEEEKPNQSEQIKIRADTLDDYFPDGFTPKQKVELIKKLVKEWHEVIENFLREGETDISEPYAILMKEAAGEYASQIFQKLHDYEYNEQMMKLYIMGGGARLIEIFGDYDRDRVTFNHDIRANAKGYEYYCYMILKQQQGRKAM